MNKLPLLLSLPLLVVGLSAPLLAAPKPTATPKPVATPKPTPTPKPVATQTPAVLPTAAPRPTPESPAPAMLAPVAPLALSVNGLGALSWGGGWLPDPGLMLGAEYQWTPQWGVFLGAAGFLQNSGFSTYFPLSLRYHHALSPSQTLFGGIGGFVVYAPGAGLVPGTLLEVGSEFKLAPHWSLNLSLDTGLSFGSALAFTTGLRGGLTFRP